MAKRKSAKRASSNRPPTEPKPKAPARRKSATAGRAFAVNAPGCDYAVRVRRASGADYSVEYPAWSGKLRTVKAADCQPVM